MWLPNLEGRGAPKYRAIADAIDEDVKNGSLRPGARLPPHRDLADHLGVRASSLYRHHPSRDALLHALREQAAQLMTVLHLSARDSVRMMSQSSV